MILKLSTEFQYPIEFSNLKKYEADFMLMNNIQYKKFLWFKITPKFVKEICTKALDILNNVNMDLNIIVEQLKLTTPQDVKDILECSDNNLQRLKHKSDEQYLVDVLSSKTIYKIQHWHKTKTEEYKDYKRFANAVRAGRRIPIKFMNDHVSIIKELFPVIITTPQTEFINWEKEYFDYAILDESSQMFLEVGLPILYLAKTKILAGDTQQMQPSRWFTTRSVNDIDEEEEDVAENAESLLDYAFDKGVFEVMLNQNYRSSSAALMSFSAKEFYNSELDVLDHEQYCEEDPIEVINVDGEWDSGTNKVEANQVIYLAMKHLNKYESMIILTFNANQRQLIEKEILEKYPLLYKAMEDEKLVVRNIENIQGDEAEIVIVSVVYDSNTNIGSTYVARQGGKHALNVAISRAKHKMIVVKSVNSKNVKSANSDDFQTFKNWLEFLNMNHTEQKKFSNKPHMKIEESFGEVDSGFERDVVDFIINNVKTEYKTKLIKQYEVGSYSIDIALVDSKNRFIFGIEVDGYAYHGGQGVDKYLSDKSRQEFLEHKGYDIYRITEIDFKLKKEKIINDISILINNKEKRLKSKF
ncbi:AAA domain-containing protein [Williamsoniiplasma luminosum]|uniref:AAA domain-containing protein n=1 Tax=Williamsoniiplasma luminosum TaxID=214888 RepID=UPI0004723131|nr:AAA domain-containing protein [Williamsoniiplasma luminosum]